MPAVAARKRSTHDVLIGFIRRPPLTLFMGFSERRDIDKTSNVSRPLPAFSKYPVSLQTELTTDVHY